MIHNNNDSFSHRAFFLFFSISYVKSYETTIVEGNVIKPVETKMQFRAERHVPKVKLVFFVQGGKKLSGYVLI